MKRIARFEKVSEAQFCEGYRDCFGEDGAAGVAVVSTGAEHGAPPANDSDGVEAAFKSLNPELNL